MAKLYVTDQDINKHWLNLAKEDLLLLNSRCMAAVSKSETVPNQIVAWFNNQPLHIAPLAVNLVHNAMARALLSSDHSIRVMNKPLPFALSSGSSGAFGSNIGFQLAVNVSFAMAFVSAFHIIFYIQVKT